MDFNFYSTNITSGFLKSKQELNLKTTIHAVYDRFYETGRFTALKCKWTPECKDIPRPHIFWDSDVAKWIEAASYIIAKNPDKDLEDKIEAAIDAIEAHQLDDGYFNSYYNTAPDEKRFTNRDNHELYCAGHLMEAAVAYYYATGKDRFLNIMEKYADLINKIFVIEHSAEFDTPGHEEIEIALLRMYKCTGKEKYLDMCRYFLFTRGNSKKDLDFYTNFKNESYDQSEAGIYELEGARGHAVRACYLYTAMAEFAHETNDEKLMDVCKKLFFDITNSKMYITGGIGSTHLGEAFTVPYDLPSETSYAETCAAISLMFFSQTMLKAHPNSVYADVIEKIIYNGMLSGISLDGESFFYENAFEINLINEQKNNSTKTKERFPINRRVKVFSCSCCPPNVNRVLASLERYVYHYHDGVYFVDQFCESEYSNSDVSITQKTNYPVSGRIEIDFKGIEKAAVRIPGWCDSFSLNVPYIIKDGYAYIENPGTVIMDLEIAPKLYGSHEEVNHCANKAALVIGPVVYCAEGIDNDGVNLHRLYFNRELNAKTKFSEAIGLYTVEVDGYKRKASDSLYPKLTESFEKVCIKLIPYHAYANRDKSDMLVWMNYR